MTTSLAMLLASAAAFVMFCAAQSTTNSTMGGCSGPGCTAGGCTAAGCPNSMKGGSKAMFGSCAAQCGAMKGADYLKRYGSGFGGCMAPSISAVRPAREAQLQDGPATTTESAKASATPRGLFQRLFSRL